MSVRAMLVRVRRLEQEQARAPASPFEHAYGSLNAWESECRAGVDAGRLDRTDMLVVVMAVRRWHGPEGPWAR